MKQMLNFVSLMNEIFVWWVAQELLTHWATDEEMIERCGKERTINTLQTSMSCCMNHIEIFHLHNYFQLSINMVKSCETLSS